MRICKQCNIEHDDNMKFCPECGSKLEPKPNVCPNCGTEYNEGQKFCTECGFNLVFGFTLGGKNESRSDNKSTQPIKSPIVECSSKEEELQEILKKTKSKRSSVYFIKEGTRNIPSNLLQGSSHRIIYIPSSVTIISKEAFANCKNLKTIVCEEPKNIVVTSMKGMFMNCSELIDISFLAEWNTTNLRSTEDAFKYCSLLQDISPLENWDVSSVKVMNEMFFGCSLLKIIKPLANWNLNQIRDIKCMFANCKSLTSITALGNWGDYIKKRKPTDSLLLYGCDMVTDVSPLKKWGYSKSYINEFLLCRERQTMTANSSGAKNMHSSDDLRALNTIDKCIPNVFFIKALSFDITYPDGKQQQKLCGEEGGIPSWTGTGFLLSDGRFVTARHVVEAWAFPSGGGEIDKNMIALNIVANNGGKVVAKFVAISSDGTQIQFTSDNCTINRKNDKVSVTDEGAKLVVAKMSYDDTDYAYFNSGRSAGLSFNNNASTSLPMRTELVVLGFPLGIGANSDTDINPIFGSGIVAKNGLQNGVILTTDTNYEQGNSGGPVFKENNNGELEVIGLVSAGAGRSMGFIVPIAAVK